MKNRVVAKYRSCLKKEPPQSWKELGKERPIQPIRYPADNSDPWYFGQGHGYTVIDAPWGGTMLTAEEVQRLHENWSSED